MRNRLPHRTVLTLMALVLASVFISTAVAQEAGAETPKSPQPTTGSTSKSIPRSMADSADMPSVPRAGTIIRNQMGMEFAYIPAGTFMMGSTNAEVRAAYSGAVRRNSSINSAEPDWFTPEKPKHQVTIPEGFYMGRYEVTQAQWRAVMGGIPLHLKNCDQCPVEKVSWNDAQEFIRRMNARGDGYTYRLPSEAEWEYACRAGTTTAFAYGDSLSSEQANFIGGYPYGGAATGHSRGKPIPVGSFQPNAWGLYDMHGNVWEWCEDIWHRNYKGAPSDGSAWKGGGDSSQRVLRGGSWGYEGDFLRSASRIKTTPDYRVHGTGFRVVALAR